MVLSPKVRKVALAAVLSGLATAAVAGVGMRGADASQPPAPAHRSLAEVRTLAVSAANGFVSGRPAELHASASDSFLRRGIVSSAGTQYVAFDRTYSGLPVIGGDFVVVTDSDGRVTATSVAQTRTIAGLSTQPSISSARAAKAARTRLTEVDSVSTPRLVVYAHGTPRLAWEIVVRGAKAGEPSRQSVYVDARTGTIVATKEHVVAGEGTGAYSGPNPLALDTTNSNGTYSLKDPNRALECQDLATKKVFTGPDDTWGNGDATSKETGCVDALFAVQTEWRMLSDWLGRNGMDGNGGAWPLRVGLNQVNAYYDGTQVAIGHNNANQWISSIDVVAHEFGHGIDDTTPGGISGSGTQEFIADVFGAVTEAYSNQPAPYDVPDFLVGEEINLVGSGPIRNMYDPSKVDGDPNCYSSSIPNTEVHAAAGPGNHWFYLLAQGNKPANGPVSPTCDNSDVTGVGIQKAAKILYNAMLMKTSGSSYLKYRTWTLTAAKNLFPGSCTEFDTVKAAWDAVSVPAQSGDPTCDGGTPTPTPTPSPTPTPTTTPGAVDFTGVAALSNCSASVIRYADSKPTDYALGLTNGHCYEGGMPAPGQVIVNKKSRRAFTLLSPTGTAIGQVRATKVLYSTMTKTDVTLYQLGKTYAQLAASYQGFTPLTLAQQGPADGTAIGIPSGYWKKVYSCSVDKTVYQLKEASWTWSQSIKYKQPGCETIGGTSGSPVVDATTHEVAGINNTGNENGERCTLNNPCEVDESGNVTVEQGAAYGQQTWWFYTCLNADHSLNLTKEGCVLPAPQASHPKR